MKSPNRGINLTHHCVVRFLERSRPALDVLRAREELEILVGVGDVTDQPPNWFAAGTASDSDAYLIVGEDLVIPLARPSKDDAPWWRPPASCGACHLRRPAPGGTLARRAAARSVRAAAAAADRARPRRPSSSRGRSTPFAPGT